MTTIYHFYYEIEEPGIYRRVDSRENKSEIFINEGDRPRTPDDFVRDYYIDGDDAYWYRERDEKSAPSVSYEKIDELENVFKYLPEPFATLLKDPFKDDRGVMYANEGKTLVKAPRTLEGEYQCREGVEVVFRRAFEKCDELTEVVLPKTLKEIGFAAFADCRKLVSAELPISLEKIDSSVFSDSGLVHVTIPTGVSKIPSKLFAGCKALEQVNLHDGIIAFDWNAFDYTKSLFKLTLPKHIESLGWITFRYSSITDIVIPGSVKVVDRAAFYRCSNLCYVVLSEGVEELEDAFGNCKNLEYVVFPASLKKVDEDVFENSTPLLYVPQGTMDHFQEILPERLHKSLREGEVPEELKQEVEKKIAELIRERLAGQAKDEELDDLL